MSRNLANQPLAVCRTAGIRTLHDRSDEYEDSTSDIKRPKITISDHGEKAIRQRMDAEGYDGLSFEKIRELRCPFTGIEGVPSRGIVKLIRTLPGELKLAKDTGMLDPKVHDEYPDTADVVNRTCQLVYLIEHHLDDQLIGRYILPHSLKEGARRDRMRQRCMRNGLVMQRRASLAFKNGVKATRKLFVAEEFDLATLAELEPLWKAIFDRAPKECTSIMLGSCAKVIDLNGIFDYKPCCSTRKAWIAHFRTLFVWGCNLVCEWSPGDTNPDSSADMRGWQQDWRSIPARDVFRNGSGLDVWNIANVPVNAIPNRNRRVQVSEGRKLPDAYVFQSDLI